MSLRALLLVVLVGCASVDDGTVTTSAALATELTAPEIFARLHPVFEQPSVEILSDGPVEAADATRAGNLLTNAYTFDLKISGLEGSAPALTRPIDFGLASPSLKTSRGAAAFGSDDILAALADVAPPPKPGLSEYVLAHELTHLSLNRVGAPVGKMPIYLFEGIAVSQGLWFTRQRGLTTGWPMQPNARRLVDLTGDQAKSILATFRTYADYCEPIVPTPAGCTARACRCQRTIDDVGVAEAVGGLFVEYLRAHVQTDTHHRLGRVWTRIGNGETIDDAVLDEYETPLGDLESAFVAFVSSTEGHPEIRLKGTVLDGVVPSPEATPSDAQLGADSQD